MRTARVLPVLLLGAVAGTLMAGGAGAEPVKPAGQVTAVSGQVTVTRTDMTPHLLRFRDALYWRDVVDAHKEGLARVLLGGKATVTIRELSRLELREEKWSEGTRYVADLVAGKVRASVARMLMRSGDGMEVWTFNTVASVRGTDFIVETLERPAPAAPFGLLGARDRAQAAGDGGATSRETVVVTLSGLVAVSNRLAGTGRVVQIGAYEAARLSGKQDPVRVSVSSDEVKVYLKGLTPPRSQEARNGDKAAAVETKVEGAALTAAAQSVGTAERTDAGSGQQGSAKGQTRDGQTGSVSDQSARSDAGSNGNGLAQGHGTGQGNGLALGLGNSLGNGNGLANNHPSNGLLLSQGKLGNGKGNGNGNGTGNGNGNGNDKGKGKK